MKPASIQRHFSLAAIGLLTVVLGGCGTDIISYNREFRQQGFTAYNKTDYISAASLFQSALRHEPGDYTSRYYLAQCDERLGHLQPAIEQYRTCLDVMTNSMEGKGDLSMRRKVLQGLAGAIAREPDRTGDLAQIESQPRTAETATLLARISRYTGDADVALTRYQEAQRLDPKDPIIAKECGLYLEQLGQTAKADGQLRRAYALNSKDEEVAAALRRLGVVPGPSLKDEDGLVKPVVPLGPLPEVDLTSSSNRATTPAPQVNQGLIGSSTSPRD